MDTQRTELIGDIERLFEQLSWQGRRRFARQMQTFGLTVPQYLVLRMVGTLGPNATMSEVGEALQLPASSMTSITDRLVRDGLVERGGLPGDRRAVGATITPAGVDLVATVERARRADLTAMVDGLSDADQAHFARVLARMSEGVEDLLAEATPPARDGHLVFAGPPARRSH
jgi:DNA-binding MarR family transcriptional regulator